MFSVGLTGGGDSNPQLKCDIFQLIKLFPTAKYQLPLEEYTKKYSRLPLGADPSNYFRIRLTPIMDPDTKKITGTLILPTHQIFNNPNISITPSLPLVKQPAIASASRPPWSVPVSPPVSIVPLSCEPDKSAPNSKETQKNSKRTASYPISNRTIKKPRLSITKPTKPRKDYNPVISNQVVNHQIKKNDTIVSSTNAATCIPSTSNAVIRSSQEIPCVQSSNEELQLPKPELNCKEDSSHLNINKNEDGILKKYFFMTDNQFKFDDIGNKSGFTNSNQEILRIQTKNEMFEITRPEMMDQLLIAMGMVMKKTVSKEELETLKQNSDVLQPPKFDWSSETKSVTATSTKTSPTSHNNISNSKNQSNQVSINKSQIHTINQQPPSKQTIKISNIAKQQPASSNISSKMLPSTIKQTDIKHHVSNNQSNNTSLKHNMVTAKHIQTSNKQKLSNKQLPMSSKHPTSTLVSTPKKVVNLCNVKPTVTHQSPVKDVKKCIKCKVVSEDEVCAACRMASHLKNVTVTRIETPSTSANIVPEGPIVTPIKPIDVPSSSINSVSLNEESDVLVLSSGEEDDDSVEPDITKVETAEALNKYTDKLTSNPKLLEDKLWQKDLSIKDYFKIEECNSVHIGSFQTVPARNGDMLVCLHGIRMVIRNLESEPVTIDLQMDNIVKIMAFYGEKQPFIIIYTDHLAAVGIQCLLNMNEDNKKHFYNPLSKDAVVNKIIWFFHLKKIELDQLEKVLKKLPKKKYSTLSSSHANKLLNSRIKDDDESKKKCEKEEVDKPDMTSVILVDRLSQRTHYVRILDYKMLSSTEFLNDILLEYYMDYVYTNELNEEERSRSCVFSTYFYSVLAKVFTPTEISMNSPAKVRHQRVRKWTKHVDIFKKDFIFVPINENSHWYMAVICFPHLTGKVNVKNGASVNTPDDTTGRYKLPPCDSVNQERCEADPNVEDLWLFDINTNLNYLNKYGIDYETDVANHIKNKHTLVQRPCILVFDSLCGGPCRARITATLREWVEQEYITRYNDRTRDFSPSNFKACLVKVPQQPNYYDCGLFALYYYKLFFKKPLVDYTFPIRYLENWFHPDEVSKNSIQRRELNNLIFARMKERGCHVPAGMKLPVLDFTPPKGPPPQFPYNLTNQFRITQPPDASNSINLSNCQNSSNPSNLPNRNPGPNSPRPSTSQNQPKNPNPSSQLQNNVNRNNIRYHNNHQYYDNHIEDVVEEDFGIAEEEINLQFNENDQYDEDEQYEEDGEYDDRGHFNRAEYFAEMGNNLETDEDVDDEEEPISDTDSDSEDVNVNEDEAEGEEVLEHEYRNEPFHEFHRNILLADNGNVPYVNGPRFVLGNHRGVAHPNENFQPHRPNNRDVVYNNDNDELHEIEDEDEDEDEGDIDQIQHHNPNHNIDEDDYPDEANLVNHHRHDNHFNHNRLAN
ncbi:uncharacterized protein LOC111038960 isoform X2 [Myzus persicae]|uniref:uncharacterized protein LOC111038960 isoform X2 n=1 Tax=Myzus persicae TaxID=13164 RepID=UPI000B934EAF|nr:uncharacterized protein LOC111038960 isoform X2 [Myzus persicae]